MSRRTEIREGIIEAQNHRCAYCGCTFGTGDQAATMEHVTPRSHGGKNGRYNLVAACFRCNQMRGDENAYAFFERKGWHGRYAREPHLPAPSLEWGPPTRFAGTLGALWPLHAGAPV